MLYYFLKIVYTYYGLQTLQGHPFNNNLYTMFIYSKMPIKKHDTNNANNQ